MPRQEVIYEPQTEPFEWVSDMEVEAICALYDSADQLALDEALNQKTEWNQ